jgi:hypothetical protein
MRVILLFRFLQPEGTLSIQTDTENIEQIRERLCKMSDLELRQYGRAARDLSEAKKNFGPPNPAFAIQLAEARSEWRRRYPAKSDRAARKLRLPNLIS